MTKIFGSFLITTFALLTAGCGAADKIERTYDCKQICDKYAECYDNDLDKSECVDTCESKGDADPDFEAQASDCEACIDDSSCLEAAIDCASDCGAVVSESAN